MERDPLTREFVRYRTAGDAAALARVFDGTAPHLLKIARHLLRDRALAEDAVSNAYLAAVECAAEFDDARPILPWLVGVLLNKVRAIKKREARHELDAIAASVIGGASLMGGRGSVSGAIIGAIIFGLLSNILQLHNINSNLQLVLKGLIIVGTVLVQERNAADLLAFVRLPASRRAPTETPADKQSSKETLSRNLGGNAK